MDLAPKNVGEILSDALTLLRRHARRVMLVALPFAALELVLRDMIFALLALISEQATPEAPLEVLGRVLGLGLGGAFGLSIVLAVVTWVLAIAVTNLTAGVVFGQALAPGRLIKDALARIGGVAWTAALWLLAIGGLGIVLPTALLAGLGFITMSPAVLLVGGPLWVVWATVVTVVLGLRWALWPQVLALEGMRGLAALRRSKELMGPLGVRLAQNPKFRLSLLLLVYLVLQSAVQQLFMLPVMVRGFTQTPPFSDLSLWTMPVYWSVPLGFLQVLSNSIVLPLSAVLSTLFYFDLRVRHEGFDLDLSEAEGEG